MDSCDNLGRSKKSSALYDKGFSQPSGKIQ